MIYLDKKLNHFRYPTLAVVFFLGFGLSLCALGQTNPVPQSTSTSTSASSFVASVNGKPIDAKAFEQVIKNNVANGLQDTEQLRSAIKEELIARQVMVQEFSKLGFDKNPEAISGLNFVRENFLIDFLLRQYQQKRPLTEEMIKAEYERQLSLIGEPGEAQQYLTRLIVVATESEAKGVIAELKKGSDFAKLAAAKSIDATAKNGGELGWVLPAQVLPAIGTVMVNLKEGGFSALPIQTPSGWYVIKVEEKRPFKIPTLEESRSVVIQTLQQLQKQTYIQELIKNAKIVK
jgi:peptidyl-prolyl cis-trans isomerase C